MLVGWFAFYPLCVQMGMGKTACAVGAIQMNPPPADWRKNRAYQSLRARDHLCESWFAWECVFLAWEVRFVDASLVVPSGAASVVNNMPHGGTLIVMPPTLIDQWWAALVIPCGMSARLESWPHSLHATALCAAKSVVVEQIHESHVLAQHAIQATACFACGAGRMKSERRPIMSSLCSSGPRPRGGRRTAR
jgi:hypothetical protein